MDHPLDDDAHADGLVRRAVRLDVVTHARRLGRAPAFGDAARHLREGHVEVRVELTREGSLLAVLPEGGGAHGERLAGRRDLLERGGVEILARADADEGRDALADRAQLDEPVRLAPQGGRRRRRRGAAHT